MAPRSDHKVDGKNAEDYSLEHLQYLLKAPSKDFVRKLLQDSYDHLTSKVPKALIEKTADSLEIQIEEASKMLVELAQLIKIAVFGSMTDPREVYDLFPDDFHKNLRELLSKLIAESIVTFERRFKGKSMNIDKSSKKPKCALRRPSWRSNSISEQVSLPRLANFDWRIDVKTGSNGRMAVPSCLLQLKVDSGITSGNMSREGARNVNVELTKETLETMLDGLGKIRDQLNSVVSR